MKTINFSAEADVSDIFSSGSIREIANTFSYSCEKMCMHILCSFRKILRKLYNSLRFRAMYGIILRVMFSEKVPEVFCVLVLCQKCYDACIFGKLYCLEEK